MLKAIVLFELLFQSFQVSDFTLLVGNGYVVIAPEKSGFLEVLWRGRGNAIYSPSP